MPDSILKVGSVLRAVRRVRVTSGLSKSPPANALVQPRSARAVHAVIDNLAESLIPYEVTFLNTNRNPEEPLIACDRGLRSNGIFPIAGNLAGDFFIPARNPRFLPKFRNFASGAGN
jgi:hypothetical protein